MGPIDANSRFAASAIAYVRFQGDTDLGLATTAEAVGELVPAPARLLSLTVGFAEAHVIVAVRPWMHSASSNLFFAWEGVEVGGNSEARAWQEPPK